jgi:FtsP/CotA-like multicopper oxidase with cupredoxin domain
MDRRDFLTASGAALTMAAAPWPARLAFAGETADGFSVLRATSGSAPLLGDQGGPTALWAYNGVTPGPEIRVRRGERVRVRLVNELDQPTTIHWHGIRIDNAMDGVPDLTQAAVPPGESFDYDFTVPDAGTYWYHTHNRSWEQMARGLYGPLIVDGDAEDVEQDLTLIVDDWRLGRDGSIDAASFGSMMDWSHAGRLGNWVTVNSLDNPRFDLSAGTVTRLRLINTANARIFTLNIDGLEMQLAGLDGQVFDEPVVLYEPLTLSPAQRADVIVTPAVPGSHALVASDGGDQVALAQFDVSGLADEPCAYAVLKPNGLPEPDLGAALAVELLMEGGAMGMMGGARMGSGPGMETGPGGMMGGGGPGMMGMRELVGNGMAWAMNGVAGMPEEPLFAAKRGQSVRLTMINDTRWPHAMHLHGHHFRVLSRDGRPEPGTPWRDTVALDAMQRAEIALLADNPGKWLIHCHMVEHMAAGMMTWFEVG